MDLSQAIDLRRARRKYLPEPLDDATEAALRAVIDAQVAKGAGRIELVIDDGGAFGSFTRSYGMFTGVRNYVGLVARNSDKVAIEKLGYYGEIVALSAVGLGLGTCWVGGSFDRARCPFSLQGDERVQCVITVGPVADDPSAKERLIRGMVHRHTKTIEQMSNADAPLPNWFTAGMVAVQKAPSAVCRQPVVFDYRDGVVSASVKESDDDSLLLDLGIAKLHFELGAGGGTWQFGNGGAFTR